VIGALEPAESFQLFPSFLDLEADIIDASKSTMDAKVSRVPFIVEVQP